MLPPTTLQLNIEPTTKNVDSLISQHDTNRYIQLQRYYEGIHPILNRVTSSDKPNNKLINNYPGYITDVNVGYFMGVPISYSSSDEELIEKIQGIFNYSDEQEHNTSIAKDASIRGHAFELLYMDPDSEPRLTAIKPENIIMVYSTTVDPEPLFAIRYWMGQTITGEENQEINAEVYTENEIISIHKSKEEVNETGRRFHPFGCVPVVEYLNNDERQSDFEKVLSLINAYDTGQSNTANDFDDFTDAILKIVNMSGTQIDDIAQVKKDRVILCDGDGDADWLIKTINDAATEHYKDRLKEDIHTFSKTPSLTDEAFAGNLSGVAIKYKLIGLEFTASQKERLFKKAVQRRIKLLTNYLKTVDKQYDYREVQATFTRNIPVNVLEKADMVHKFGGQLSNQTLISQLPFIEDAAKEKERLELERAGIIDLDALRLPDETEE